MSNAKESFMNNDLIQEIAPISMWTVAMNDGTPIDMKRLIAHGELARIDSDHANVYGGLVDLKTLYEAFPKAANYALLLTPQCEVSVIDVDDNCTNWYAVRILTAVKDALYYWRSDGKTHFMIRTGTGPYRILMNVLREGAHANDGVHVTSEGWVTITPSFVPYL